MNISTKELRIQPGKILEKVARGIEVFITFRGKKVAKLIPVNESQSPVESDKMFGMWKDRNTSVEEEVRNMRKGRTF